MERRNYDGQYQISLKYLFNQQQCQAYVDTFGLDKTLMKKSLLVVFANSTPFSIQESMEIVLKTSLENRAKFCVEVCSLEDYHEVTNTNINCMSLPAPVLKDESKTMKQSPQSTDLHLLDQPKTQDMQSKKNQKINTNNKYYYFGGSVIIALILAALWIHKDYIKCL